MQKKLFISWLCLIFLSTFFVGCKPQESPIVPIKKEIKSTKKVVKKTDFFEEQTPSETLPEEEPALKENHREVVVNVTAEGTPTANATVSLASRTASGNYLREKQTENSGTAKFSIPNSLQFFYVTAFNDDYAAVNVMKTGFSPTDLTPVVINLNLENEGVIITGILEDKPEKIKNFNARIEQSKTQYGYPKIFVISTNILDNKVKFPPIDSNLNRLRVCVEGENIPQCYSEEFNTTDGEDKEVNIEIPLNVTLKGIASLPDGSPVNDNFLAAISPMDKSKGMSAVIQKQVTPASDGTYEITGLSQGSFNIRFMHPNYNHFETDLILIPPETELNFSFEGLFKLRGKVINAFDRKPMEGVEIKQGFLRKSAITDEDGLFELEIQKCNDDFRGRIKVDEPGYGKIDRDVYNHEKFVLIVLEEAGNIVGKITTEDGTPVPRARLSISKFRESGHKNKRKVSGISRNYFNSYGCNADSEGNYEFLNVIAPAKYGFHFFGGDSGYSLPSSYSEDGFTAEVEPGETTECNLIVQRTPTLALKAQDDKGNPITKYSFTPKVKIKGGGGYSHYEINVSVSKDEWYYANSMACGDGFFSCTAKEKEGGLFSFFKSEKKGMLTAVTNDIPFFGGITNYITLIFSGNEPTLTGYVLKPDGSPAKRARVYAGRNINVNTDNSGYFEIYNQKTKKGDKMRVSVGTFGGNLSLETNLLSDSKNVELILQKPYQIKGKVFLENLDTPAKNFTVACFFFKNQSYSSTDGSFVLEIKRSWPKKETISISANSYLPEFADFDFTKGSVCDVGNIILKPGEPANIKGRIINQNGEPVRARAVLKYKKSGRSFFDFSDKEDGIYGFEGVPPGEATVSVTSKKQGSASHVFKIEEGDDLELPDLILK